MKLKYNFVISEIAGNKVAIAVGDDSVHFSGYIKMNGTGADIFSMLKNEISKEEIISGMAKLYPDQSEEILTNSVESFLEKLYEAGVLE